MLTNNRQDLTGLEDERLYAMLAYLTVLVFVPLLTRRDDPYVYFHVKQGLVLLIGMVIALIAAAWVPQLGSLLFVLLLAVDVIGLVQALLGRRWKIPLIGTIAQKFDV